MVAYFRDRSWTGIGCDHDSRSLEYGRARGLELLIGDPTKLIPRGPFDLVILSYVFERLVSPIKTLNMLAAMMRLSSVLYLEFPGVLCVSMLRY